MKELSSIGFTVVRDFCNLRKSAKNVKRNISSYILIPSRSDDSNPPAGSRDVDQRGLPPVGSEIWGSKIFGIPHFLDPLRDVDTILIVLIEPTGNYKISPKQLHRKYTFRYSHPPNYRKHVVFVRFLVN